MNGLFDFKREKWLKAMIDKGHDPKLDERGKLYITDTEPHDGPVCRKCWWQECWNCISIDEIEPCEGDCNDDS